MREDLLAHIAHVEKIKRAVVRAKLCSTYTPFGRTGYALGRTAVALSSMYKIDVLTSEVIMFA